MIQFANLTAAVLLASLLLILLMHLFIRRPDTKTVSSTLLYRDLAADVRRVKPRSRPRFSWLLLLQLLAALFLTAALMQPNLLGWSPRQQMVLVIDGSASMQASDVQPQRFQRAVEQALAVVSEARGAQLAVIWAGAEPQLQQTFTSDSDPVEQALQSLEPSSDSVDMAAALTLADSLLADSQSGRIAVFSDASFPDDGRTYNHPVQWYVVGQSSNNIGLVSLDAVGSGGSTFDIMARVANNTDEVQNVTVELLRAEEVLRREQVDMGPGQNQAYRGKQFREAVDAGI